MGWLISLIIAGAIIYYLVIGSRADERDSDTVGVDSGDVLIKPGDGDAELADEFTHFGGGAELVSDEEYAEESDLRDKFRRDGDDEEFGEEYDLDEEVDRDEYDEEYGEEHDIAEDLRREEYDEEYGDESALGVEDVNMDEYDGDGIEGDGMLMGKDTGLRVDEEAESIANARSSEEMVDEEVLDNLNMVGDDFGMLMGVNDEVDLDEVHPKRATNMERLSAKLTGDEYGELDLEDDFVEHADLGDRHDEEVGEELFNGDELGGVRYEDADDDLATGTNSRMSIDVEDETYMNADEVYRETKNERNAQRTQRRRRRQRNKK